LSVKAAVLAVDGWLVVGSGLGNKNAAVVAKEHCKLFLKKKTFEKVIQEYKQRIQSIMKYI